MANKYPDWAVGAGVEVDKIVEKYDNEVIAKTKAVDERTKEVLAKVEKRREFKASIKKAEKELKAEEIKASEAINERVKKLEAEILKEKKEKEIAKQIERVKSTLTDKEKKQMEAAQAERKKKEELEAKATLNGVKIEVDAEGNPVIVSETVEGKLITDGTALGSKVIDKDGKEIPFVKSAKLDADQPGKVIITRCVAKAEKPQGTEPSKAKAAPIEKEKAGKELPVDKKLNDSAEKKSAGMTAEETAEEEKKEEHEKSETEEEEKKEELEAKKDDKEKEKEKKEKEKEKEAKEKEKEKEAKEKEKEKEAKEKEKEKEKKEKDKVKSADERVVELKAAIKAKKLEAELVKKKLIDAAKPATDPKITKETTRVQETTKRPSEISEEAVDTAKPMAEEEKKFFDEVASAMTKLTEITNAKNAEMKTIITKYAPQEQEGSKAAETAVKNYYNHAAMNEKVNDLAKLAEGKFAGVYERIKDVKKKYTKEEQAKLEKLDEQIKALSAKYKELEDTLGKYIEKTREITVVTLEKKPAGITVKTSINAEDQAQMIETAETIEESTSLLDKMAQLLKDIFKIGNSIEQMAPAAA
jgi:hypothetical protein